MKKSRSAPGSTKRKNIKITVIAVVCTALCLLICCILTVYLYGSPFKASKSVDTVSSPEAVSVPIPYQTAQTAISQKISTPFATVITSPEELENYRKEYGGVFDLGDSSIAGSFMQIAGSYGSGFFDDNILVLIALGDNVSTFYPSSYSLKKTGALDITLMQNADLYNSDYVKGGHIFMELPRPVRDITSVNVKYY